MRRKSPRKLRVRLPRVEAQDVLNFGKVESRFERSVWRRPIAPIVIPVGAWHFESGNVSTHSKLRTSALSKFVTPLAHRFVSNKGRTQTEANAAAKAAQKKMKKKLATAVGIRLDRALWDKWASQAFKKK
jgi:hypothetical protein